MDISDRISIRWTFVGEIRVVFASGGKSGTRGREGAEGFRFRQNARLKGSAARGLFAPRGEQCKQWPGRSAAVSPGLRGEYNYIMNPITI